MSEKQSKQTWGSSTQIFILFQNEIYSLLFFCLLISGLFAGLSIMSYLIIKYVEGGSISTQQSLKYFFIYVSMYVILIISIIYSSYLLFVSGYEMGAILNTMIFSKVMKYPLLSDKSFEPAQIINYGQMDSQSILMLYYSSHQLINTLLQVIFGFGILFFYIGISVLSGIAVLLGLTMANIVFFCYIGKKLKRLSKATDTRIKVAEQIIQIIRFIKINILQKYFLKKIQQKREKQLKTKKNIGFMKTFSNIFLSSVTVTFVVAVTLLVYLTTGNQIRAAQTFFVVIVFKNVQGALRGFPSKIQSLVQVWVSIQRIQKFLKAKQIKDSNINLQEKQLNIIQLQTNGFVWKKKSSIQQLDDKSSRYDQNNQENPCQSQKNINIQQEYSKKINFKQNELTMIIGDLGSGKSSLLLQILGEITHQKGRSRNTKIFGSIAYCPQKPWIINATVRQNIILGNNLVEQKLREAIYFACFDKDLELLDNGLDTQIGEKGVNLSGGQKVRLNIARALYANKDIYLLDDILSAVDVHVGEFLMEKMIKTYLRGKTIIIPTHAMRFLSKADNIIIMEKGKIISVGSYSEVSNSQQFKRIIDVEQKKNTQQKTEQQQLDKKAGNIIKSQAKAQQIDQQQKEETENQKRKQNIILVEKQESYEVPAKTYVQFFRFSGGLLFIFVLVVLIAGKTVFDIFSSFQIQSWCKDETRPKNYLYYYLGFGVISSILLAGLSLYITLNQISSNRKIHKKVMERILPASLTQFFNRVPQGMIINRLGKDFSQMDDLISNVLQEIFNPLISIISTIVMLVYSSTLFILIGIGILVVIWIIGYRRFIKLLLKLYYCQKMAYSPINSSLMQLMNGLDTVRGYKLQGYFLSKHIKKINQYLGFCLERNTLYGWFCLKTTATTIITFIALAYCLFFSNNESSTRIGLLFAHTVYYMKDLVSFLFYFNNFQCKIISAQRIFKLSQIQPEIGYKNTITCNKNQTNPDLGKIQFLKFSSRYRKGLPLVLKNITLKIEKGEKIAIVGRTGAGKSSILNCLLRFLEPSKGSLMIHGKEVREYEVEQLRKSITMIDQEAILLKGTFRENLDPYNDFTNQEILSILKQCKLDETVENKGGLSSYIDNNTFSAGERQLISICRALLKKSSIVLIDQATANIDVKNDNIIQQIIRKMFKNSTVITIAHRLSTLKDYDKILVLNEGRIIQWGDTRELLQKQDGIYRRMCQKNDQTYLD